MSMHFAPQWAKPIKPSGSSALSSSAATAAAGAASDAPQQPSKPAAPSSPFPALGQARANSPTTAAHPSAPAKALSYSRVTHAPQSPSMSPDGYFPNSGDGANGGGNPSPYPFRYSREQILGIWDEKQFKERPIELMQVADTEVGGVLVSKSVVSPVGLRELSENEKRLLSSSVHPPVPVRRQMHSNPSHGNTSDSSMGGRRGAQTAPKDTPAVGAAPGRSSSAFGGGFGRGEGGALGGSKYSGSLGGEGRQPGAIGGGFGGVPKRAPRRDDDTSRPSAAANWRPTRNPSTSGTFEGVLGFGGAAAPSSTQPEAPSNGRLDSDRGWGAAEKQWRAAPTDERPLHIPTHGLSTQSVIATASATPVTERDAQLSTPVPGSGTHTPKMRGTPQQDLGTINWYYRDPNGQEQGPFAGSQMQEWYSHQYFQDDLPIRRENETTFHQLSELKTNTGNTVQPFLTAPRPRLPPNLPIPGLQGAAPVPSPGGLNDSFGRLNMGGMPAPQPQYHPSAFQGSPFGQPQFNAAPQIGGFGGAQQWHPAPGSQSPARLNGAYGSIGGTQANYPPYGAPIGTPPIPRPDVFGSAVGHPSPWGAPAPVVNQASTPTWQQQQQPTPQHAQHMAQPAPIAPQQQAAAAEPTEPSYFPPVEEMAQTETEVADIEPEDDHAESEAEEEAVEDQLDELVEPEREPTPEPAVPEPEVEAATPKPAAAPATSVWNKAPKASTKSVSSSDPTPAQTSKLPPPHASLPPKPTVAPVEPVKETTPPPATATPVEKSAAKPAPWAKGDNKSHGPSLREIQEAEARQAAARKAARAEARAAAAPASIVPTSDDLPSSMSWGLPTSKSSTSTPTATSAPAWGGASDGPKKTLKQIQEEEERRREKQARAQAAASPGPGAAAPAGKRGYADLAAHSAAPTPAQSAASAASGWTTVGAGGKFSGVPPKPPASIPAKPVAATAKPTVTKPAPTKSSSTPTPPVADDQPSIEFIRWTKQALTGLTAPIDDFISMLLQFPIDPPASSRAEVQEIIADSVYAASSTLDGRRFASEFMTRRKADAKRDTSKAAPAKIGSLADVVKTQPKPPAADLGFKVVKAKKKRA